MKLSKLFKQNKVYIVKINHSEMLNNLVTGSIFMKVELVNEYGNEVVKVMSINEYEKMLNKGYYLV